MTAADLFPVLCETTIAGSAAILLALALRRSLRNAFGAGIAYSTWALVPLALLAVLLPAGQAPTLIVPVIAMEIPSGLHAVTDVRAMPDLATWAVMAVACGALVCAMWMFVQQRRFIRGLGSLTDRGDGVLVAQATEGLPAVVGLWHPRIVLPADAMRRYAAAERDLMLAHERAHIARGDLAANAVVALLRCVFWFNPLVHVAAMRFRHDQELACDQQVVRRHPDARRAYGEAMLKTQLARGVLPLGCHWGQTHPLRERIEMLKQPLHSMRRRALGRATAVALLLASGYAAWAAQPATTAVAPAGSETMPQASIDDASRMRNPPVYPVDVQKRGITGMVVMIVDVAIDGSASAARIDRSAGDQRLDASALEAVRTWKFKPAMKDGKPVVSQVRVPVDFRLDDHSDAPVTARQAMASTAGNFNTYERMLTSLSDTWMPPKPPRDEC